MNVWYAEEKMLQFSNSLSLINASCSRHNPRKTSAKSNTTPQISQRNPELGSKVPPHRRQIPNRGRSYLRCSRSMIRCVVAMCASRVFVRGPSSCGLSLSPLSPAPASIEGHFQRTGNSPRPPPLHSVGGVSQRRSRSATRRRHPLIWHRVCQGDQRIC